MLVRNGLILFAIFFTYSANAQNDCGKASKLLSSASILGARNTDSSDMLSEAYSLCPSSVEISYAYGSSLVRKSSYDEAMKVFSSSDDPILHIAKASLLADMGKYDEASAILEKVIGENPRKVEALQALATLEYKRQNYREAERLLRLAIQEKPDDYSLFYNLGITLEKLKRLDESRLSLLSSIRLNSSALESYCALARIYMLKGNILEAKEASEKAITIGPENSISWFSHGLVNQQLGKHDEAIKSIKKSLEINANDIKARLALIISQIYIGKKEAVTELKDLAEKNSEDADIIKSLLWAYLYLKDYKSAQIDIEKIKTKVENDSIALNNLGVLHKKLGKNDEAESYFRRALELNPGLKQAQLNLNLIDNN